MSRHLHPGAHVLRFPDDTSQITPEKVDLAVLAIQTADRVATAQIDQLECEAFAIAAMVADGFLPKQDGVDIVWLAARANNLVRFGVDFIQDVIAPAFEVQP